VNIIGLRKEEKLFETRVPLVPEHIQQLAKDNSIEFLVEPSDQRAFTEEEYTRVGAKVSLLRGSEANIILGVKEMPNEFYEKDKVYIFFSHTIKGQEHNMPMLKQIMNVGATLIDYEKIIDSSGRRLIFFGNWAGLAGMSDTLRMLGERLEYEHITPNPFAGMKPTRECRNLTELKEEIGMLARRIQEDGLPNTLTPFIVGFAGYGNVSKGAQDIFNLLPHKTANPDELSDLPPESNLLYKCVFKEEHMVRPKDDTVSFELQDYYSHGLTKYEGVFSQYIPHLTILMNCIYWSKKYPRLATKQFIRKHWHEPTRRLKIVGDISCDIEGAVEFTVRCTDPGDPAFTYLVNEDRGVTGIEGEGPVVLAIDNLPSELPRESSTSFSETLRGFVPILGKTDFTVSFEELDLPKELKDAVIVHHGKLTENYTYLQQHVSK
jgi:alpha-aminoadipic semialdehyde synthase